ncbi:hypothetical protein CHS0354_030396 [Potamilus streckersoni]|uniref:Uncharacterized protein n=1 Tax=Potamilus streckersoni TaxID=2493646 RepID=A0AAE0S8S7_9BIVA|nr:hypothetical protein CHS0354_030396 [Potamilus streckersoni]
MILFNALIVVNGTIGDVLICLSKNLNLGLQNHYRSAAKSCAFDGDEYDAGAALSRLVNVFNDVNYQTILNVVCIIK